MEKTKYITLPQLAKLLGISRIAVYKKVKKGLIKAVKIGRIYAVDEKTVGGILGKELKKSHKREIDIAVKRTVDEYGEVLKRLGRE